MLKKVDLKLGAIDWLVIACMLCSGMLGVTLYHMSHSRAALVLPLCGALMAIGVFAVYRLTGRKAAVVHNVLFPVVLVISAAAYCAFFFPGTVPDEPYHYRSSYAYASLILGEPDDGTVRMADKPYLDETCLPISEDKAHYRMVKANLAPLTTSDEAATLETMIAYRDRIGLGSELPQTRLAPALGIIIARLLGLNGLLTFYVGRFFNLLYGVVLIALAIRITPTGKNAFMAVSLLPMTLHLLGSYSYDVGIIGVSFLLIAVLLRAICSDSKMSKPEIAAVGVLGCILAPCKTIYCILMLPVLLIPSSRFASKRAGVVIKVGLIAVVVGFLMMPRLGSLLAFAGVNAGMGGSNLATNASNHYTLGELIADPAGAALLFATTLVDLGDFYIESLVGGSLGWFQKNLVAPEYYILVLAFALLVSSLSSPEDDVIFTNRQRLLFGGVFVLCLLMAMMAMCLGWTASGNWEIEGVQGRYLIPCLPLLLLAARGRWAVATRRIGLALLVIMCVTDFAYLAHIVSLLK